MKSNKKMIYDVELWVKLSGDERERAQWTKMRWVTHQSDTTNF